jgi:hypothetical protein
MPFNALLDRWQDREVSMHSPTKRIAWITEGGTGIGLAGAAALAARFPLLRTCRRM